MSSRTILVVEDDPKLRFIIEKQLRDANFDTVAVEGGDAAMRELGTLTPNLVLLNILLPPGMDGIELCERIRADQRLARIPVIFLTWRKDPESRVRCLAAGADDYVTKPWQASDLILRISNAIESASSRPRGR
jgi:two-component system phosphate regulon response regulator PhoB